MRKRHPNYRLVKIHRNYTVEEAARLFKVHKNTVRQWIKGGLPTIDSKRPKFIHGQELSDFLQVRRLKNKRPCKPGEIYCVRCREPKVPAGNMADYQPKTETLGNLFGICPDCGAGMYQGVSLAKLDQIRIQLDISFPQALRHIVDSSQPTVNSDLGKGESDHANAQCR